RGLNDSSPRRRRRSGRPKAAAPGGVETPVASEPEPAPVPEPAAEPVQKSDLFAKVLAKPPVRKLAKDHGLDLTTITPTGQHGEVTRADVNAVPGGEAAEAD